MARFHSLSNLINYFFLVLVSFFIIPSYAQDIEEVIVEAERQEANTLDVTESLDIFDLEDLEVYRITGLNDVANNVPGLTASPSGSQGLRFTLRGIGARDSQLGVESKIGLYVDGAFLGRASGLVFDIVDLEMVEVAKGPQGFRFGRHAIGGNINLITAKANVEDFYARGEVTLGNYDRETYKATLNLPVNDQFAVRASAFTNKRDGWVENTGKGVDWGGFEREGFKIAARWYATDDLIIDYSYDQADFITQPVYYQPEYYGEGNCTTNDIGLTNVAMFSETQMGVDCRDSEIILTPLGEGRRDNDKSTNLDIENSTTEADGHSLIFDWAYSENHNLKFISTYRTSDVNNTFYFFPNTTTADTTVKTPSVPLLSEAISRLLATRLLKLRGDFTSGTNWYEAYGFENVGQIALASNSGTPEGIQLAQDLFDHGVAYSNFKRGLDVSQNGYFLTMDACAIHPEQCANRQERLNNSDPNDDPVVFSSPPGPQPWHFLAFGIIANLQTGEIGNQYALGNQFNSIFSSPEGGLASLDDHRQTSFELRFTGAFLDERLKYSTGLYYFKERTGNGPGPLSPGYLYADLIELLDFGALNSTPESVDDFGFSYITKNRLGTDSYALYGTFDYRPLFLDERMEITLGFRYSEDARTLTRQKLQAITLLDRGSLDEEENTWYSFDPMFKVAYDLTYDFTGYFSVTSGYRPGNYNVDSKDIPDNANNSQVDGAEEQESRRSADIVFDTESLVAYELGGKGSLLDGLLDLEFATYYYDVKDGQETVIFPNSPVSRAVVNADGYAFGAELDTTWHLTDELSMIINYAHLRSGSDSYATPFLTDYGRKLDYLSNDEDKTLARDLAVQCRGGLRSLDLDQGRCEERKSNFGAPVNSWQVGLDYTLPSEYFGELFFHLGYNYKESHYVNDTLTVDDRHLWDARISTSLDQDWGTLKIALWGQNIFDNEYQVQKFELHRTVFDIASYGDPRMFGIDIIGEWF